MFINKKSSDILKNRILSENEVFCRSLFLSARWFIINQVAGDGLHVVILPGRETAEYCSSDFYSLVEGDKVFFLPSSGKNIEKSNYKSSLSVQRTAAIEKILNYNSDRLFIVTYPEALEELLPSIGNIKESLYTVKIGDNISFEVIKDKLVSEGFNKVDFVSAPGQFAIRGSIIDIFSFSRNNPFRISFWGDEVEDIHLFDCNTQLSISKEDKAEIISDIISEGSDTGQNVLDILPDNTLLWLDSSDMYKDKPFFELTKKYKRIYTDIPLSRQDADAIEFDIAPQPVFNKNFELLSEDIKSRMEEGYEVYIYGE